MAITALKLKSYLGKTRKSELVLNDEFGLSARISPKGKVSFQLRYNIKGKSKRYKIGNFPQMTLKQAREKAEHDSLVAKNGIDPQVEELLETKIKDPTLKECIDFWVEEYATHNRDKPQDTYNLIMSLIPSTWLSVNVERMATKDWHNLYATVSEALNTGRGRTCLIELRAIMRYCVRSGYCSNMSFDPLKPSDFCEKYVDRSRYFNPNELSLFWRELQSTRLTERNQLAIKLAMIYGCRIGEIASARKENIDLESRTWTIPREDLKGGKNPNKDVKPIKRPIPELVLPLFSRLFEISGNTPFLLENKNAIDRPVPPSTLSKLNISVSEDLGIKKDWVLHDFRRTLATLLTDMGCPIYVTEKMLGHKMTGVLAVYNRSDLYNEMEYWYTVWVDKLLLWADEPENVIELHIKKAS